MSPFNDKLLKMQREKNYTKTQNSQFKKLLQFPEFSRDSTNELIVI